LICIDCAKYCYSLLTFLYLYLIVVVIILQLLFATNYFILNTFIKTIQAYAIVKKYIIVKIQSKAIYKSNIITKVNIVYNCNNKLRNKSKKRRKRLLILNAIAFLKLTSYTIKVLRYKKQKSRIQNITIKRTKY